MTSPSEARLRLFVALALPADARAALWEWSGAHLDPAAWRRVPEANLHVTLAFLGPRPAGDVGVAGEVLGSLPRPPGGSVALECSGVVTLPPRRPRVAAVVLGPSPALAALQASVAGGLERAAVFSPERRPFLAHVTVGRARRGVRVSSPSSPVPVPSCAFSAAAVVLYASRPGAGGSRYEALVSVPLDEPRR